MRLSGISACLAAMSRGILSMRKWGILIVMVEPQVRSVSRVMCLCSHRNQPVAMQPTHAIGSEKKAAARFRPCRCFLVRYGFGATAP